jgi:hypothetical protein
MNPAEAAIAEHHDEAALRLDQGHAERFASTVERHDLVGAQRKLGVGLPFVVTEFDFIDAVVKQLDHRPNLAGSQLSR